MNPPPRRASTLGRGNPQRLADEAPRIRPSGIGGFLARGGQDPVRSTATRAACFKAESRDSTAGKRLLRPSVFTTRSPASPAADANSMSTSVRRPAGSTAEESPPPAPVEASTRTPPGRDAGAGLKDQATVLDSPVSFAIWTPTRRPGPDHSEVMETQATLRPANSRVSSAGGSGKALASSSLRTASFGGSWFLSRIQPRTQS